VIGSPGAWKAYWERSRVHKSMTAPPSQLMLLGYLVAFEQELSIRGNRELCTYGVKGGMIRNVRFQCSNIVE
jgi:hypothetical protein